ncbi:MAG: response regulator [Candidatus Lernaella stagnicola]|nr:response regulator [Candidatus Lernaella stagnicola]
MAVDPNIKILCVDDFSTMRRIIKSLLRQIGLHQVVEADGGATALEILKNEPIELIISDWSMPKVSGLELLRAVRADDRYRLLPFLMIASEEEKDHRANAMESGANEFLVKPFKAHALRVVIEKLIGK